MCASNFKSNLVKGIFLEILLHQILLAYIFLVSPNIVFARHRVVNLHDFYKNVGLFSTKKLTQEKTPSIVICFFFCIHKSMTVLKPSFQQKVQFRPHQLMFNYPCQHLPNSALWLLNHIILVLQNRLIFYVNSKKRKERTNITFYRIIKF